MFSLNLKNLSSSFIVTVLFSIMVLSLSNNANAACPPGFHPVLPRIVQQVNPTCKIIIDYCISDVPGSLGTYEIYISEISYFGNCVIPTNPPSYPSVDWEYVLATIIVNNQELFPIGLCPGEIQVRMFNGSCFRHIEGFRMDENGEWVYCDYFEPCDMEGLASCRQYFTACLQLTQGQYVVVVTLGPVQTLFSCVDINGDCQRLCE